MDQGAMALIINEDTVQSGEFLLVAKQKKSDIFNLYEKHIKGETEFEEEKFWNGSFDGIQPIEKLKEETVKQLNRIKTEQDLAMKYLKTKKFNYSEFINNLKVENKRRRDSLKNKKPVYGPVQYSEEFYYGYLYNNMVIKLKEFMGKEVFAFSEKKYKDFYEANKDNLFRNIATNGSLLTENKELPGYKTLEVVKDQIRQKLIDEEYEKLILSKTINAVVREQDEFISQFTAYFCSSTPKITNYRD
jgi:hypothetical protein